jgi:hypothetical protein
VKFNWDWEYKNTKLLSSIPFVKKLIYMESQVFHPDEEQDDFLKLTPTPKQQQTPQKEEVDDQSAVNKPS